MNQVSVIKFLSAEVIAVLARPQIAGFYSVRVQKLLIRNAKSLTDGLRDDLSLNQTPIRARQRETYIEYDLKRYIYKLKILAMKHLYLITANQRFIQVDIAQKHLQKTLTSSEENTWQIIQHFFGGAAEPDVESADLRPAGFLRAIKTTMFPMSAMYEIICRAWSIMASWKHTRNQPHVREDTAHKEDGQVCFGLTCVSALSTLILCVEMNRSTSVIG